MGELDRRSEVKHIKPKKQGDAVRRRDPSLTGGDRAATPQEQEETRREKEQPKEPPIIESDVT